MNTKAERAIELHKKGYNCDRRLPVPSVKTLASMRRKCSEFQRDLALEWG